MDYWTQHQEMWFVISLGDLIASVIFCRKSLFKLCSQILKIVRFPSSVSAISKDIRLFCLMFFPFFAIEFLRLRFFRTCSLSYSSIYWWIVPSTIAYIVVPLIMIKCDKTLADKTEITEKEAKTIGLVQLLSFLPGISRFYAMIGAMRRIGYTCLKAFQCYIFISIPLDILVCIERFFMITGDNLLWERIDLSICVVVLIFSIVFGYLILRIVELFWSKISLTAWSLFYMVIGVCNMSYSVYFVFTSTEAVRFVLKTVMI